MIDLVVCQIILPLVILFAYQRVKIGHFLNDVIEYSFQSLRRICYNYWYLNPECDPSNWTYNRLCSCMSNTKSFACGCITCWSLPGRLRSSTYFFGKVRVVRYLFVSCSDVFFSFCLFSLLFIITLYYAHIMLFDTFF